MKADKKIERLIKKKDQIAEDINMHSKAEDDKTKFTTIIKLCKSYKDVVTDLQLEGVKVRAISKRFTTEYWQEKYDKFIEAEKIKINEKKSEKDVTKPPKKFIYNIVLCWTTKADYCICDSIIGKVRDYLLKMDLKLIDTSNDNFIDRSEHTETYKIKTTEDIYKTILSSAEYILDISADSVYDRCNVGIFGKRI